MISSLTPKINALILDLDGVLWRDHEPIGDLPAIFQRMEDQGWRYAFATNNSMYTPDFYRQKLAGFGVCLNDPIIVNSPLAIAYALKNRFPQGGPIHLVGETGLRQALSEVGFYPAETDVIAVVAGMDRQLTYAKIDAAAKQIRRGIPFYGTNPDNTYPTTNGLAPGAGTVLAALEAASGVTPTIVGKPSPILFEAALERLHSDRGETLVIGDRLDTDILGGQRAGLRTALVLSGVSSQTDLNSWQPPPDLTAPSLAELVG